MDRLVDKEIMKASDTIDKALASITSENRGEVAVRILTVVRNLNDQVAYKIWHDLRPSEPRDINKVAKYFASIPQYKFIARFHKFLGSSVSHFTPTEEGSERLMLKYYGYILKLKKAMRERYGVVIIKNIDMFPQNLDKQTKEYYQNIAEQIELQTRLPTPKNFDNYYIDRIKPFFVNHEIYYEVVLEPAHEKVNKFNRVTAFTKCDITTNYCVALSFSEANIEAFKTQFPIKIITEWHVSIRPCELKNFAFLMDTKLSISRTHKEYLALMAYLEQNQLSLVDIIDLDYQDYNAVKQFVSSQTQAQHAYFFDVLDRCREISIGNRKGKNIIRYCLYRMNNRFLRDQQPHSTESSYAGLNISGKCMPFDQHPFSFNPARHTSNLNDLFDCVEVDGHEDDLLARHIIKNAEQEGILFTPIADLKMFGNADKIKKLVSKYNNSLYSGFRPASELGIFDDRVYSKGREAQAVQILQKLLSLSGEGSEVKELFAAERVISLKDLPKEQRLDDDIKANILSLMFAKAQVHLVYGAAGTGKTTLVNLVAKLMEGKRKIFLSKTHPAVENLHRRVKLCDESDEFETVDSFIHKRYYGLKNYDLIVVDECSTVKNEDIYSILCRDDGAVYLLVGDTYQIESIGFGNWFGMCRKIMPEHCCHELTTPHRSPDEHLQKLWEEVRNMNDDNVVLEKMVRADYSHEIDDDIFSKRAADEIILCLNYNGLYGLNNINRLLQLNNTNPAVTIGIWQFKVDDPILFNDSGRFQPLYNNLKGRIVHIQDNGASVNFIVEVDQAIDESDILFCDGLEYISGTVDKTKVGFSVSRTKPYSSDEEQNGDEHIVPFQIAYAVSIHKAQGLEYDSVKVVIADESEEQITHNIFYTAITRARKELTIYWSPEVCNRVLARIRPADYKKDFALLKAKNPTAFGSESRSV